MTKNVRVLVWLDTSLSSAGFNMNALIPKHLMALVISCRSWGRSSFGICRVCDREMCSGRETPLSLLSDEFHLVFVFWFDTGQLVATLSIKFCMICDSVCVGCPVIIFRFCWAPPASLQDLQSMKIWLGQLPSTWGVCRCLPSWRFGSSTLLTRTFVVYRCLKSVGKDGSCFEQSGPAITADGPLSLSSWSSSSEEDE